MYQVGAGQGQSYFGDEGKGFASIISLPKTENIQVWKYENDNKRKQALIDQQRQENQKAMGILANVVPDGFYKHDKDLNDWMAKHVDSASRVIGNPYDLRTAEGAERVKDLNALKGAIAASKNFRDQYNKYQDMKKGDYSPESIAAAEKYFTQGADLKALTNGNLTPFSLQPKNPIDTEMAALLPVQQLDAVYKKGGKDLIDDPEASYTVLSDALKQPQTAAFYDNKIAAMTPAQQAELNTNAVKATNAQKRLITPQMYLAQQFLPTVVPREEFNTDKYENETAKGIMDITTQTDAGGVHKVTMVNYGNDREKIKALAKDKALLDIQNSPRILAAYSKRFGTSDPSVLAEKVANEVIKRKDQQFKVDNTKPTNVTINNGDGSVSNDVFDKWLKNVDISSQSPDAKKWNGAEFSAGLETPEMSLLKGTNIDGREVRDVRVRQQDKTYGKEGLPYVRVQFNSLDKSKPYGADSKLDFKDYYLDKPADVESLRVAVNTAYKERGTKKEGKRLNYKPNTTNTKSKDPAGLGL